MIRLKLLPFREGDRWSHMLLEIESFTELLEAIGAIETAEGRDVPEDFRSFQAVSPDPEAPGPCYGTTVTDGHSRLLYVKASSLVALADPEMITGVQALIDGADINRAIWAFLAELDADWRIALYWD